MGLKKVTKENPEWLPEDFCRALAVDELPEHLKHLSETQICKKCGNPFPKNKYTMCSECDYWHVVDMLN